MKISDETLVEQVLSGNIESFSLLVRKYQGVVFALAFSMTKNVEDARDLAQESFIKAYVNLPTLKEPSKFAAWLKSITRSTCVQWLRDTANRCSLLTRMPVNSPKTPEDLVLEKELREIISAALDVLPEKLRLTTLLYYTDGLSYQEIAAFQEVPVTTVKGRIYESRKRLKVMLVEEVIPIMKDILKWTGEVEFRTKEKAPIGFESWTFFWALPMVDPTAKFEYQVLTPDGSLYAPTCDMGHSVAKAKETGYPKQYGTFLRSDFSLDFYGGDPKVFHG